MARDVQVGEQYRLCSRSVHRLLITGVMIAAKLMDDKFFSNCYFAKVCSDLASPARRSSSRPDVWCKERFRPGFHTRTLQNCKLYAELPRPGAPRIRKQEHKAGLKDSSWRIKNCSSH